MNKNNKSSNWNSSLSTYDDFDLFQLKMLNNEIFYSCFSQSNIVKLNAHSNTQSNESILTNNYPLQYKRAITGINLKEKPSFMPNQASNFQPISLNNQLVQSKNNNHALYSFANISNSFCKYSRKVFVGGLPPDIDENEIFLQFNHFGELVVDWPHKSDSTSTFPPKGYAFLIFEQESSVQELINNCFVDRDKYYICISSSSVRDKPVQIRPWCLSDSEYFLDTNNPIDVRRTIFVGGVPRPLKSYELATIINNLFGGVSYAAIDIDSDLKYPKGAGRVSFSNHQSYVSAICARFVQLKCNEIDKRAEVKPYVLDDQICDVCKGLKCNGKYAQYFCPNVGCLQYFCEICWSNNHSKPGKDYHKPLVKEGTDRPRTIPFKFL